MTNTPYGSRTLPHYARMLRMLRRAASLSLESAHQKWRKQDPEYPVAVVLGSYERNDREPTVPRLDQVLAPYGYRMAVVPSRFDDAALSRLFADATMDAVESLDRPDAPQPMLTTEQLALQLERVAKRLRELATAEPVDAALSDPLPQEQAA